MMKMIKLNSLYNKQSTHILVLTALLSMCCSASYAEKPPLTDPAFYSDEQLKQLHRDVRKPIDQQVKLQEEKAEAKNKKQKVALLKASATDPHHIENRLVERQQQQTAAVNSTIVTKHLGNERTSPLWAGNQQDIFTAANENNSLQLNISSGRMEPTNIRGDMRVNVKVGERELLRSNLQVR